eukprot:CAMPEP_0202050742 /NCGR_PEP_ID=MMETSP0963-20130614/4197_1 /ASSEMBLY_ACC=CAM_ASM_000494 /TAXON_ID=4773 /ORGANISM="Schizochytrium aggregatum, Strain ATCC28209" /LENGTH=90 /DNA_ID=CAMNT_0048615857 /DNA_START=312 /DNA_END=581 /DNA_ORIENTATION=+
MGTEKRSSAGRRNSDRKWSAALPLGGATLRGSGAPLCRWRRNSARKWSAALPESAAPLGRGGQHRAVHQARRPASESGVAHDASPSSLAW